MQRTLFPIVAGCVAAVCFAVPKPAAAMPAAIPAIHYGETNAGLVEEAGRRYWRRRYVRPYAYGYGYRPWYRSYGYYRPYAYYGAPYGYYGRPYGYWGRPGISLGFAF